MLDKVYRLRSSIAVVQVEDIVEFFKTGTREQIKVKVSEPEIFNLLSMFNGERSLSDCLKASDFSANQDFLLFVSWLNGKGIIIEVDEQYGDAYSLTKYRLIGFLEDYFLKTSDVLRAISTLAESKVAIFGLGAVGTWVCKCLAMSGVKNFILVDPDHVDISNLHRQDFYFESDLGMKKAECVAAGLRDIDSGISSEVIIDFLDENFFERNHIDFDLAINCSDSPTVDATSRIIGTACMGRGIPHIIGGGYNLHLSLVGQSVIPGITSCVRCYDLNAKDAGSEWARDTKKLYRPNRKIGSFGPLSAISASITSEEAIKILIGSYDSMITKDARLEFDLRDKEFRKEHIERHKDCEWCNSLS